MSDVTFNLAVPWKGSVLPTHDGDAAATTTPNAPASRAAGATTRSELGVETDGEKENDPFGVSSHGLKRSILSAAHHQPPELPRRC